MLKIANIVEMVENDEIVKVRGYVTSGEYFEIRSKQSWVDIRIAKDESNSLRTIYREQVGNVDTYQKLMEYFDLCIDKQ